MASPGRLRRGMVTRVNRDFLHIHPSDDVAVALRDITKNTEVEAAGKRFLALDNIPVGHKMALRDLQIGENVLKYGNPIGHVTQDVPAGSWLHSHNVQTNLEGLLEYQYHPVPPSTESGFALPDTFMGYLRPDGRAATRNEIWIIPTVSCVNTLVRDIAAQSSAFVADQCDGVFALPHNTGCSQMGEDQELTKRLLAAIARHPNAGGVLLVSLGCENMNFDRLCPEMRRRKAFVWCGRSPCSRRRIRGKNFPYPNWSLASSAVARMLFQGLPQILCAVRSLKSLQRSEELRS